MVENDRPLIKLAAVVMQFVIAMNEGPNIVAISAGVVGQKRERIAALPGQIVDRADQTFAFAVAARSDRRRSNPSSAAPKFSAVTLFGLPAMVLSKSA